MVVDQVHTPRSSEGMGQVEPLPNLDVHARRFLVGRGHDGAETSPRVGVGCREKGDIDPGLDQALGEQRHDPLPRPVVPRRHAPGDGGEHADAQRATVHGMGSERVHPSDALCAGADHDPRHTLVFRHAQPQR